jgi:hypothetical protein
MFVFLKLCLAHLIGDFVLQVDELYQLKVKHAAGHLVHALSHALVTLLVLFPYLGDPFIWVFVIVISFIHLFQDVVKYRLMRHKQFFLHLFLADQALHFLFLSAILFFPVSSEKMGFPNLPTLHLLYTDSLWTIYSIAFLAATFCGSFTLNALSVTYLKDQRPDHFITTPEMVHGIVERAVVAGIFLLSSNPVVFALSPLAGALRLFSARLRSLRDYALSFAFAALVGILFRLW